MHIHDAVQVEACRSGMLYLVNVVGKDGSVLSEVAFNSQTGCFGANTVQVLTAQTGCHKEHYDKACPKLMSYSAPDMMHRVQAESLG